MNTTFKAVQLMLTTFIIVCTFIFEVASQNPAVNWDKTLGGSEGEGAGGVVRTDDGSIYMIGTTLSSQSGEVSEQLDGEADLWLVKLNAEGEIIWDNSIGGSGYEVGSEILFHEEKLYIIAMSDSPISGDKTAPNYGARDLWLICLDLEGNILWDKTYGGDLTETRAFAMKLQNSNFLLMARSASGISGNKTVDTNGDEDYWIIEVDPEEGEVIQQASIGSEDGDIPVGAAQSANGDIFLYGTAEEGTTGDKTDYGFANEFDIASDIWIVKVDSDFNVLQDKCFGGTDVEYDTGQIIEHNDYLYFLCASQSGVDGNKTDENYGWRDYWVVKTDLNLDIIWDRTFGGNYFETPGSLLIDDFGKLFISGTSQSPASGNRTVERYGTGDCWMVITDLDGEEIAQEAYGGNALDLHSEFFSTADGEIILLSSSDSDASGVKSENSRGGNDCWILSLDASQYLSVEDFEETAFQISTYPNPFSSAIQFDLSEVDEPQQLSIYSSAGKLVHRQKFKNAERYTWQPTNAEGGIYFYVLECEDAVVRGKVVKK